MEKVEYRDYPILCVDEDEENLQIFSTDFGDTFTVFTAVSGPEGLALLDREFIALVIAEQRMGGMTGMEFLGEVARRVPEMVTMLVTPYSDLDILADGVSGGRLYSYVVKPWEIEDLKNALRRGIDHYHLASERDRLHREQIDTVKKMARTNKLSAVGTLAAGIAHEVRNPLVSVQTFLEMVPEKLAELSLSPSDSFDREFWESFHALSYSEIGRIRTLISELVNLARPATPDFSEEDLSAVIGPMLELTRKEAAKKGIFIESRVEPELPPVWIDPSRIKQVLLNLILNGLYAAPEGGRVEIVARRVERKEGAPAVQLLVRDNGEGIPPEIQEQLFDPFFTTKDPGVGTGLGLTICHQIMEEHGGEIEIRSRLGEGTDVILEFSGNPPEGIGATAPAAVNIDVGITS